MISPLRPGDRIALVAPSSSFDVEKFHRARDILESKGYQPAAGRSIFQRRGYLAGTETERAEDLIQAISNPDVSAVICIRGGFGSSRILPWLPFSVLRKTPKIFLGYSDATFLHLAFHAQMGWTTFHGPSLIEMVDFPEKMSNVLNALSGVRDFSWQIENHQILRQGMATGTLLGGNLTCLCHLLGTPYFPDTKGALLLLEDRGEVLYRLDRILTQLKLAGVLDQIGGLILGHFHECGEAQKIWDMVLDQVKYYSFPVVADLPFGHGSPNQVIPLGSPFMLNTFDRIFKAMKDPFITGDARDETAPGQ